MGMFSEIIHDSISKDLLKILKSGLESNNDEIKKFCLEKIYPLWQNVVGEAFRKYTEDEIQLIESYKKINGPMAER